MANYSIDDFIKEVREYYIKAREPLDNLNGKISRGRCKSVSGIMEDLVAKLLVNELSS